MRVCGERILRKGKGVRMSARMREVERDFLKGRFLYPWHDEISQHRNIQVLQILQRGNVAAAFVQSVVKL